MHVIARPTITSYIQHYPETKQQLLAWLTEAEHARWTCPQDVTKRYRSADFPTDQHVIFDIKGTKYRLVVRIRYADLSSQGTIFIRWFGPHKEYDQLNVENL